MRTWIKSPLAIYVSENIDAGNGIVVKNDRIEELVKSGSKPQREIDSIIDASDQDVLPGLINTHHHYYQTLTRAVPASLNKGLFPWLKSLYPIWAGLGVDGSASNDCSNMIQEVRQAFLLNRLQYGASRFGHIEALNLATSGSAACLGRTDVGEIKVGSQADLAMFKLNELRFSGVGDPLAALILCNAHKVDNLMIAGKWKISNGDFLDSDIKTLQARHDSLAQKLRSTV
jgi:cytosine/adenosine deaminase-related metal-dependent hydrolase